MANHAPVTAVAIRRVVAAADGAPTAAKDLIYGIVKFVIGAVSLRAGRRLPNRYVRAVIITALNQGVGGRESPAVM